MDLAGVPLENVIKARQPFTTSERGSVLVVDDVPFVRTTLTVF
jgi:hypothetical protein